MNDQNLTHFKKGDKKTINAAIKGGKAISEKKAWAAKLRELKKRNNMTDSDVKWFERCLIDPAANLMDMAKYLDEHSEDMDPKDYVKLRDTLHKSTHGDKHINMNLNIDVSAEIMKSWND